MLCKPLPIHAVHSLDLSDMQVARFAEHGIHTTHQLLGKFLSLRGPGITMKAHIDAFYEFLREVGLGAYMSSITKAVAEKVNTWIPSTYDEATYLAAALRARALARRMPAVRAWAAVRAAASRRHCASR